MNESEENYERGMEDVTALLRVVSIKDEVIHELRDALTDRCDELTVAKSMRDVYEKLVVKSQVEKYKELELENHELKSRLKRTEWDRDEWKGISKKWKTHTLNYVTDTPDIVVGLIGIGIVIGFLLAVMVVSL